MSEELTERVRRFLIDEMHLGAGDLAPVLEAAASALGEGLRGLDAAAAAGDAAACRALAHALRGNLLNLGLADLAEAVLAIRAAAAAGDMAHCRALAAALRRRLHRLL